MIRYSREKIYIDFNGKTIESDLNGSNYIYASSNGKRYMREGKLWITNENDIKLINADIFAEEAQADGAKRKDSVYYYGNVVK